MSLDQPIRQLVDEGLQMHIWPTKAGYQANVRERGSDGWICFTAADPIEALATALRQRTARVPDRKVISATEMQIDLEEAIAAATCRYCDDTGHFYGEPDLGPCGCPASPPADEFDGLLG